MNILSRTITGIILIVIGTAIMIASAFTSFIFLIYGIAIITVGIVIFFNKKEDQIEQRKDVKGGKKK